MRIHHGFILTSALVAGFASSLVAGDGEDKPALMASARQKIGSGDFEGALVPLAAALKIDPDDGLANQHMGYSLHMVGRTEEAYAYHLRVAEGGSQFAPVGTYNVACVHALRGEKDAAIDWLTKWSKMPGANRDQVRGDSDLTSLAGDPRFDALVKGLPVLRPVPTIYAPRRSSLRVAYFGGSSLGQLFVDYGPVAWQAGFDDGLTAGKFDNRRWRLGADAWTSLDTSMPLMIGGARLEPGEYYLVAEKSGDAYNLIALDPAKVRSMKIDPSAAARTVGGEALSTEHSTVETIADELSFNAKMNQGDNTAGTLVVAFGPHRLKVPFEVIIADT